MSLLLEDERPDPNHPGSMEDYRRWRSSPMSDHHPPAHLLAESWGRVGSGADRAAPV